MNIVATIVTWNHETTIGETLRSFTTQTLSPAHIIIVDNASADTTLASIHHARQEWALPITVLRNPHNRGFAQAHNQAIELARRFNPDAIVITNPDLVLTASALNAFAEGLRRYPKHGSFGGKLLRLSHNDSGSPPLIDSTGLLITPTLHVVDRGANQPDRNLYKHDEEVFGHSGALCLYRREALEDLLSLGPVFAPSFIAYKEDIDCAWRLQRRGWRSMYLAGVIAYHRRGSVPPRRWRAFIARRKERSVRARALSATNDYATLIRSVPLAVVLRCLPWFLGRELARWGYLMLMEPRVALRSLTILKDLPCHWKARRAIERTTLVGRSQLLSLLKLGR